MESNVSSHCVLRAGVSTSYSVNFKDWGATGGLPSASMEFDEVEIPHLSRRIRFGLLTEIMLSSHSRHELIIGEFRFIKKIKNETEEKQRNQKIMKWPKGDVLWAIL